MEPGENISIPRRMFTRCGATARLGEIAYVAERKREAIAFIREDYARFLGLCLKRFIYYWGGVPRLSEIPALAPIKNSVFLASSVLAFWGLGRALRKRRPGAWLFFWLILLYPAVYYAVFPHPRYRHPIEPELGILIVYVISEAEKKGETSWQKNVNQLVRNFNATGSISTTWIVLLFEFQRARDLYFLSGEESGLVLIVETIDVILRRQHKIAAQILHAVGRAGAGRAAHLLGLQHLGVRTGHGMDVQCTLRVADFAVKDLGFAHRPHGPAEPPPATSFPHQPKSCASRAPEIYGTTSTFMFMPS